MFSGNYTDKTNQYQVISFIRLAKQQSVGLKLDENVADHFGSEQNEAKLHGDRMDVDEKSIENPRSSGTACRESGVWSVESSASNKFGRK